MGKRLIPPSIISCAKSLVIVWIIKMITMSSSISVGGFDKRNKLKKTIGVVCTRKGAFGNTILFLQKIGQEPKKRREIYESNTGSLWITMRQM